MITMQKMGVELSADLRKKYGLRAFPLVKGDVVKITRGSRKGEGGKVVEVDHLTGFVTVDGITVAKSDNKQKAFFLRPEKLMITRLDFSRQDRIERIRKIAAMKKIELNEEDLKPEPEPEPEPEESTATDETVPEESPGEQQQLEEVAQEGEADTGPAEEAEVSQTDETSESDEVNEEENNDDKQD